MLCILTIFINHNTNLLCDCTINKKNVQEEKQTEPKLTFLNLDINEEEEIKAKVSQLSDPEMRNVFLRIMRDDKKRKKAAPSLP